MNADAPIVDLPFRAFLPRTKPVLIDVFFIADINATSFSCRRVSLVRKSTKQPYHTHSTWMSRSPARLDTVHND